MYRNTIKAGISGGNVTAGSVAILAKADRTVDAKAFAAGGGVASVNGSVVVISIGASTDDENTSKALQDTIKNAQKDVESSFKDNSDVTETYGGAYDPEDTSGVWEDISMNLADIFRTSNDRVNAYIAQGTVTTTGGISIKAEDTTTVSAIAGSAGGGVAAIGGAVVIVTLNARTEAGSGAVLNSKGNVDIIATTNMTMEQMLTVSGSGGLVGLGGSVAILNMTGNTCAYMTGAAQGESSISGKLTVHAVQSLQADVKTFAGGAGAGALGAAVAVINLTGTVDAHLQSLTIGKAGDIDVKAALTVNADALNGAANAGGVGAGAAVVDVKVDTEVKSYGDSVHVKDAESLSITAEETLTVDVQSYGLAGGALGAATGTTATVFLNGNVWSALKGKSEVKTSKDAAIASIFKVNKLNVTAAGAAAGLVGAGSGTYLNLSMNPMVKAYVDDSTINAAGSVWITASYNPDETTYQVKGAAGAAGVGAGVSGIGIDVNLRGNVNAYAVSSNVTAGSDIVIMAAGVQNLSVECGTFAGALGAGVGGSVSNVQDGMIICAYTENSDLTGTDGTVRALYNAALGVKVTGGTGGLLAAGIGQKSVITEESSVTARITGGTAALRNDFSQEAGRTITITAKVTGHAYAAGIAGGATISKVTVQGGVYSTVSDNTTIAADGKLRIRAVDTTSVDNSGYASSAAIAGTANDVTVENKIVLNTKVDIGQNCSLTAGDMEITAATHKYYRAYASGIVGGIAAFGVTTAVQNITDDVAIHVRRGSALKANKGDIILTSSAGYTKAPYCEAKGGKGGLVAGMSVKAEMNQTIDSHIETYSKGNGDTLFEAGIGDVQMHALSYLWGGVKSSIAFGVDAISSMSAEANMTNVIKSYIDFGVSTIVSGVNVLLRSNVVSVDVWADTRAETVSALHTKLEPKAYMKNDISSYINLREKNRLTASSTLWLTALVEKVTAKTYSLGDTKGVTGSVVSTSSNYTTVNSKVNMIDAPNAELRGRSVLIDATAANTYRKDTVNYSNKAEYKAYTVTEFIKKTVERVTTVVEKVTEKVCKWLPWPFNKIIKWIVKTVVKVVRWFEEILVEKVLQSNTDKITNGSFGSSENVHLEGHIYYGANAPVNITVEKDGSISNPDVVSERIGDTIYIKSFKSNSAGELNIKAEYGTVDGKVTVHSNDILSQLSVINNSNYHLKLGDLSLSSNNDPNACNYQIFTANNRLDMTDVTDLNTAPKVIITSNTDKNVIFAGEIRDYSADFTVNMNGGNIYMESTGKLDGNSFIASGAKDIGTKENPLVLDLYVVADKNNQMMVPEIRLAGSGNVYLATQIGQYVDNRENSAELPKILNGTNFITVNAGGIADILLNEAKLLVVQTANGNETITYTYDKVVTTKEKIDAELELHYEFAKQKVEGLEAKFDENGEIQYWQGDVLYEVPKGYSLMFTETEDGLEYWIISDEPVTQYYVYKGTGQKYEVGENQQIVWSDGTAVDGEGRAVTEEPGYYLITTRTETVTETLEVAYEDGVALVETPVDGIYHTAVINGNTVSLKADGTRSHTDLYVDGAVTGTNGVTIAGVNNTDLYINNKVSSVNGDVSVSTAESRKVIMKTAGQLAANAGSVNVMTGTLTTEKAVGAVADMIGRHIKLNAANVGTKTNPVLVQTGADGISSQSTSLYLYGAGDLVLENLTAEKLLDVRASGNVILKNGHTGIALKAQQLNLAAGKGIGTKEAPITIQIGNMGINVHASNDIFLTQKNQAGYIHSAQSDKGNITILADGTGENGNLYLGSIHAAGLADICSLYGSLIQNADTASVTAERIILTAGVNIGSSKKNLILALGNGTLKATAGKDLYIQDLEGNVSLDSVQATGSLTVNTAGDILNGNTSTTNVSADTVTLVSSKGNVGAPDKLLKVRSANGLSVQAAKGIYLYHPGDASHISLTGNENITLKADGTILLDHIQTGNQDGTGAEIISLHGDILDCAAHGDAAITSPNITLNAGNGRIGSSGTEGFLMIALGDGGTLKASAKENIALKDNTGVVRAESVTSTDGNISLATEGNLELGVLNAENGQILLNTKGSILNVNPGNETNLTAKNLLVNAAGIIGTSGKWVRTNADSMTVHAGGDIYLEDAEGAVAITEMTSTNGSIHINTAGDADFVKVEALNGNITLNVTGNAALGELKGDAATGAVSITTSRDIVNRGASELLNLLANAVVLQAGGAIGTSGSPVRTDVNEMSGVANGDVHITDVNGTITVRGLKSNTGGITLITNGDTRITSMEADKEVQVTAQSGNITLGRLITNQKATVTAAAGSILGENGEKTNVTANDMTLAAEGTIGTADNFLMIDLGSGKLNADAGSNIFLKEIAGDVNAENIESANGNITVKTSGSIHVERMIAASGSIFIETAGALYNARTDAGTNLTAQEINLNVKAAGTASKLLTVSTGNNNLNIQSEQTIWITGQDTTLNLGQLVVKNGDVNLNLLTDSVNGLTEAGLRNIIAENLNITANGHSFGTADKLMTTDLGAEGKLTVNHAANIYLSENDELYVKHADAEHEILLTGGKNVITEEVNGRDITIRAGEMILGAGIHDKYVTGTNLVLEAGKGIGTKDGYYLVDMAGTVSAETEENIYLREVSGDLNAKQITSKEDVYLEADGSIRSGSDTLTNVSGKNLYLTAHKGTIGSEGGDLRIYQQEGGSLTAETSDREIRLYGVEGSLNLIHINSGTADTFLKAQENIFNGREDEEAVIYSSGLTLETVEGNIGAADKVMRIDLSDLGRLDVQAGQNAYLEEKTESIKLGVINVNGEEFHLTVPENIYTALTAEDMAAGIANITAKNIRLISVNGQIGLDANTDQILSDEDYLGWITTSCDPAYLFYAAAKGDIFIREINGSIHVELIESKEGNVSVSVQENLFGEQVKGNNITLISGEGGIGDADSYIEIDLDEKGILNIQAYGDIYIREPEGNLNIGSVESGAGNVGIDAVNGSILGAGKADGWDIFGKDILLTAKEGTIGSKERPVILESNGNVTLEAKRDIVLNEFTGDLVIVTVKSQEDIVLRADGNILLSDDRDADVLAVTGQNADLTAENGSIGKKENPLTLELSENGILTAKAAVSVYLDVPKGDLNLDHVKASEEIILTAKGSILNGTEAESNLNASHVELTAKEGTIGTAEKAVITQGGSIRAEAEGDIYLESLKDLYVQQITAQTGDIMLTGGGSIFNGLDSEEDANLTGRDITIRSAGSVGAKDHKLVIDSGEEHVLTVQAQKDIGIRELTGDLRIDTVESAAGSVYLDTADGSLKLGQVTAFGEIILTVKDSILNVAEAPYNLKAPHVELTAKEGTIGTAEKFLITQGGSIKAEAEGAIHLESPEDLYVQTMKSHRGDIVLTVKKNIFNGLNGDETKANLTGENITLQSGAAIGADGHYLVTDCGTEGVLNVQAKEDIYIREKEGDMNIGRIESLTGNVCLDAANGNILPTSETDDWDIFGKEIFLTAKGTMGTAENFLKIQGETLTAKAGGDIFLKSLKELYVKSMESVSGSIKLEGSKESVSLTADKMTAGQDIEIGMIPGEVRIRDILAGGNIRLYQIAGVIIENASISGTVTLNKVTGHIEIKAVSDLNINQMEGSGDIRLETTQSVYAVESGRILGNTLDIKAGGSIGSALAKLNTEISGTVTLQAGDSVYINERGTLRVDKITAGKTADLIAGGEIVMANAGSFGVQAGTINLSAGGAIGSGSPLQVQSSSIAAKSGSGISLTSGGTMQITQMQAPTSITLRASQILGENISTGTLDMTVSGSIGSQGSLLKTSVSTLRAVAGGFAGIDNSGSLVIEKLDAADAVVRGAHLTTTNAVNADSLELHAVNGIGTGMNSVFTANVNSFTGTTKAGSIFFGNGKNLSVSGLKAPDMIYLAADGKVTGGANAVTSDSFVFDVQGLEVGTNVNAAEGNSTGAVILKNAKALVVGGVSDAHRGITAKAETRIDAQGDFTVKEDLETSGKLQLKAASGLRIADGIKVHGKSEVRLLAGKMIQLPSRSTVSTSGKAYLTITGTGDTLMEILGTVKAAGTDISGGKTTEVNVQSGMGSVELKGADSSSSIFARVQSLGGSLNISGSSGKDTITVDAKQADGNVAILGGGSEDIYVLNLNTSGSSRYEVNGNGTLQLTTTKQDENIRVDGSGITVDDQRVEVSGINLLALNNPGGNNRYDFFDTPCTTTVVSGSGSDTYYIGKLNAGYDGAVTTEGILSPGNSHALTIQDDGGSNHYVIYSAKAPLTINGGSGSDTFVVKAFVQILSDGTMVSYQNAEMNLNGGSGTNNIEVIKSALFDWISEKEGSLNGSGLNIFYDNMEGVEVSKYRPGEGAASAWTTWMWIVYSLKQLAASGILYVILLLMALAAAGIVIFVKRRKKQAAA